MPTYSAQDRLAAAQKAGFPDPLTAVSVSLAEFGANREVTSQSQSDIVNSQGIREPSFGPWQIHLPSHPDVTQSCAMDLTCSTQAAFKISNGGTNFAPWSAFNNGSWKQEYANLTAELSKISFPTSPPASGDTGPAGPSGSAGGAGGDCRVFNEIDIARAVLSNMRGFSAADIAKDLGVTLDCLKQRTGQAISTISANPGVAAADKAGQTVHDATSASKSVGDFLGAIMNPANLWKVGLLVLGVGAIWAGGRMYLHNEAEPVAREGVSG